MDLTLKLLGLLVAVAVIIVVVAVVSEEKTSRSIVLVAIPSADNISSTCQLRLGITVLMIAVVIVHT